MLKITFKSPLLINQHELEQECKYVICYKVGIMFPMLALFFSDDDPCDDWDAVKLEDVLMIESWS